MFAQRRGFQRRTRQVVSDPPVPALSHLKVSPSSRAGHGSTASRDTICAAIFSHLRTKRASRPISLLRHDCTPGSGLVPSCAQRDDRGMQYGNRRAQTKLRTPRKASSPPGSTSPRPAGAAGHSQSMLMAGVSSPQIWPVSLGSASSASRGQSPERGLQMETGKCRRCGHLSLTAPAKACMWMKGYSGLSRYGLQLP